MSMKRWGVLSGKRERTKTKCLFECCKQIWKTPGKEGIFESKGKSKQEQRKLSKRETRARTREREREARKRKTE